MSEVIRLQGMKRKRVHATREGKSGRPEYLLTDSDDVERVPRARVNSDGHVWSFKPREYELEGESFVKRVSEDVLKESIDEELPKIVSDISSVSPGSSVMGMVPLTRPDGSRLIARTLVTPAGHGLPAMATLLINSLTVAYIDAGGGFRLEVQR